MKTLSQIKSALDISQTRSSWAKITLGNWTVTTDQHIDEDWDYYSKGWHRSHGPKISISNRRITLSRPWGRGTQTKSISLTSWAGNYLEKAIVELGLAPKKSKLPLHVRLHKAFDAKLIKTVRGHKIYQRTLLGQPVDYVIVAPFGTTFHADKYSDLIKGLYRKIRSIKGNLKLGNDFVDWKACKKLGFCDAGIKSFCNDFGFNINQSYTCSQIEQKIQQNPSAAAPYLPELKQLAEAFNYSIKSII